MHLAKKPTKKHHKRGPILNNKSVKQTIMCEVMTMAFLLAYVSLRAETELWIAISIEYNAVRPLT